MRRQPSESQIRARELFRAAALLAQLPDPDWFVRAVTAYTQSMAEQLLAGATGPAA